MSATAPRREAPTEQDGRTHYEGCWSQHRDCAQAEIKRLQGEVHRLTQAVDSLDSGEFREACRAGGIACAGERTAARADGRTEDARNWERFASILHLRVAAKGSRA